MFLCPRPCHWIFHTNTYKLLAYTESWGTELQLLTLRSWKGKGKKEQDKLKETLLFLCTWTLMCPTLLALNLQGKHQFCVSTQHLASPYPLLFLRISKVNWFFFGKQWNCSLYVLSQYIKEQGSPLQSKLLPRKQRNWDRSWPSV